MHTKAVPRWGLIVFLAAAARLVGGVLPEADERWGRTGPVLLAEELATLGVALLLALGAVLPLVP
jgi:hypothetical protein